MIPKVVVKRGRKQSRGRALLPQRCPQPVEQLPRRPCAAGLTDSRASRATRATRGDAHAARQSAPWQYCTSQHGVEQCIQDIVLGASQHASGQSERACCAPWRSTSSPPIRRSHHCTAVHEHPQLHCSTLKLRSLPLLSQLCAVQRASSAAPGRPVARPGGCGTDGGPPSECEPHRRPCLSPPRASGAKRQLRACFSVERTPKP